MSTTEIERGIPAPQPMPDEKMALQIDADKLFQGRVRKILPGRLGDLVLGNYDIDGRSPDDITMLSSYLVEADPSRTNQARERFRGMISNLDEVVEKIDETVDVCDLANNERYPRVLIVSPHDTMVDILELAHITYETKLGKDKSADDSYMYLSRLLGYAAYKSLHGGERVSVVERHITPVCNAVQVFPETESLKPLRDVHGDAIDNANRRANIVMGRHQKAKLKENRQQLIYMAPTGSQMKKFKNGKRNEPISEGTMNLLHGYHESGVPIVIAGMNMNIPRAVLPFTGRQKARIALEQTILPFEEMTREEFESAIRPRLLSVARRVSKKQIYA